MRAGQHAPFMWTGPAAPPGGGSTKPWASVCGAEHGSDSSASPAFGWQADGGTATPAAAEHAAAKFPKTAARPKAPPRVHAALGVAAILVIGRSRPTRPPAYGRLKRLGSIRRGDRDTRASASVGMRDDPLIAERQSPPDAPTLAAHPTRQAGPGGP